PSCFVTLSLHDALPIWIASSLWFGPTPANEGIRRCELMRVEVRESPESEAAILRHLGGLHAMAGRFELARELLAASTAVYADLGDRKSTRLNSSHDQIS